jgi:hypothetical protein
MMRSGVRGISMDVRRTVDLEVDGRDRSNP